MSEAVLAFNEDSAAVSCTLSLVSTEGPSWPLYAQLRMLIWIGVSYIADDYLGWKNAMVLI